MKCSKCPYYECYPDFNKCNLLKWECCIEDEDCRLVNDDKTINIIEFEKAKEYMW